MRRQPRLTLPSSRSSKTSLRVATDRIAEPARAVELDDDSVALRHRENELVEAQTLQRPRELFDRSAARRQPTLLEQLPHTAAAEAQKVAAEAVETAPEPGHSVRARVGERHLHRCDERLVRSPADDEAVPAPPEPRATAVRVLRAEEHERDSAPRPPRRFRPTIRPATRSHHCRFRPVREGADAAAEQRLPR